MSWLSRLGKYVGLAFLVILVDRCTKWWALSNIHEVIVVNKFLSLDLVMNRGISWSLFHSTSTMNFIFLA